MNWIPIVLMIFKVGVLGATIFYSLKSHRDGEKEQEREREAKKRRVNVEHTVDPSAPDLKVDG
tara:strand:- start:40 stop:228 length:189 start_codon:yes stop_codon:yes gene_type:complete